MLTKMSIEGVVYRCIEETAMTVAVEGGTVYFHSELNNLYQDEFFLHFELSGACMANVRLDEIDDCIMVSHNDNYLDKLETIITINLSDNSRIEIEF